MTHTYTASKRPTSGQKTYTHTESEGLETNFPSKWTGKKKTRVAILIPDKIDFKTKAIKRDPEGHFIILKGTVHQKRYNPCKYICTQHRSTQIYKENLGGLQERY